MRFRLLTAVVLLVLGVGVAGYAALGSAGNRNASTDYMTATASIADVVDQAVATGTVSASTTYGLGFGRGAAIVPPGAAASGASSAGPWNVTAVNVDIGTTVKAGLVLATTDASAAQLAVDSAQAALDSANAKLEKDKAKPTPDDIAKAQTTLQQAQLVLTKANQAVIDTHAKGQAAINGASKNLRVAQRILQQDINSGALAPTIEADQRAEAAASAALQVAQAAAPAADHEAQQAVDAAKLGLQLAQQAYTFATAPATPDTIAADGAGVAAAQQALAKLQSAGNGSEIVAPADGVISQVSLVVGGTAPTGDGIQMQSGPMLVTAPFSEDDIGSLALGQPAVVTIAALGQQLTGKVTRLSVLPNQAPNAPVVTYPVTITLDTSAPQLHPGMSANVAVTTASVKGVLAIPAIALQANGKGYTVSVLNADGSVSVVPVQVGLITSTLAQITSGLKAGATVIVGSSTR